MSHLGNSKDPYASLTVEISFFDFNLLKDEVIRLGIPIRIQIWSRPLLIGLGVLYRYLSDSPLLYLDITYHLSVPQCPA